MSDINVTTVRTLTLEGDVAEKAIEALAIFSQQIDNLSDGGTMTFVRNGEVVTLDRSQLLQYRELHTAIVAPAVAASDAEASNPG